MTTLHVYFSLRNQKAFQRVLDASRPRSSPQAGTSSSGGKSWNRPSPLSNQFNNVDVNARDRTGRTALHLAASATDASAPEYVRMLLAHPSINVNVADTESHWTALHRALYYGNIAIAVQLVQRSDIDISLRDFEGYTAFDLYNSTVEGTRPALAEGPGKLRVVADLLTWGANRNATLGVGDGDDRTFPEQVIVEPAQASTRTESSRVDDRFTPVRVQEIVMSKLHTAVVTDESRSNLYVCGFGSGGRLGPGQHTQYSLVPVPQLSHTIVSVALGQDHTLAITSAGEVLSWGLNRFSQLGYMVDTLVGTSSRVEEPIQMTPRKITAGLKGKFVRGVAACKTASVCWTASEVYSWGTNAGQLGYDRMAHPVQILPRVVTKIAQPVISVTITDTAMVCLLETNDVVCIYNDSHFRVNFPAHAFPSEMKAYRPPQAIRNASIDKITSCDTMIAALSTNGELFTFSLPPLPESGTGTKTPTKSRELVKPQRVWALRKKFSSVKDVALGADGSIIICTESGHVFVRARTSGKACKFQQMPYMQRVVKVSANNTGAYAALRVDAVPAPLTVTGNILPQDLVLILPYGEMPPPPIKLTLTRSKEELNLQEPSSSLLLPKPTEDVVEDELLCKPEPHKLEATPKPAPEPAPELELNPELEEEVGEEEEDKAIIKDRQELIRLCQLLERHKKSRKDGTVFDSELFGDRPEAKHGADLMIHVQYGSEPKVSAHRVILAARSVVLADVLAGNQVVEQSGIKIALAKCTQSIRTVTPQAPWKDPTRLSIAGCHPLTVLILLQYLYSDQLLTLWDWRVAEALEPYFLSLKIKPQRIKEELQNIAKALQLPAVSEALQGTFKREVRGDMSQHFLRLLACCTTAQAFTHRDSLTPDAVLCLEDRDVPCHSAVLRARSPLFQAFFDDDDWTRNRWESDGIIRIQFKHLYWKPMQYVMKYMYGGDMEMFDVLDFVHSVDELIDFMFDVMSAANELLLDRLVQICSSVILRRVNISNVCAVLSEANYYHVASLVSSVQGYMARNLETLLESRMLDDLPLDFVKRITAYVRNAQADKSPITRSNVLVNSAMEKNADWLAMQDIPQPIVASPHPASSRDGLKLSPPLSSRPPKTPEVSPIIRPQIPTRSNRSSKYVAEEDEMFVMDGLDSVPPLSLGQEQPVPPKSDVVDLTPKSAGWRVPSLPAPKVDMKAIMAEAETKKVTSVRNVAPPVSQVSSSPSETANWRTPQRQTKSSMSDPARAPGSSPWKTLPSSTTPLLSSTPTETPPMTPLLKPARTSEDVARAQGSPSASSSAMRSQPPTPQRQGMGPVITPARQLAVKSGPLAPSIRRTTSHAWTLPPVQPVVQPSPSTSVVSFAEIQKSQQEQINPKKDKRSLKEIQEEERARQVEDDFLRWWAEEEERLRLEQEASAAAALAKRPPKNKGKKAAAQDAVQMAVKRTPTTAESPQPREKRRPKNKGKDVAAKDAAQTVAKEVQTTVDSPQPGEKTADAPSTPRKKWTRKPKEKQTGQDSHSKAAPL